MVSTVLLLVRWAQFNIHWHPRQNSKQFWSRSDKQFSLTTHYSIYHFRYLKLIKCSKLPLLWFLVERVVCRFSPSHSVLLGPISTTSLLLGKTYVVHMIDTWLANISTLSLHTVTITQVSMHTVTVTQDTVFVVPSATVICRLNQSHSVPLGPISTTLLLRIPL